MITNINVRNFKLHEDTNIDATPITIFIGPNNSGKSSIFHSILCVHRTVRAASTFLVYNDKETERCNTSSNSLYLHPNMLFMDLGSFNEVLRKGKDHIGITLKGYLPLVSQYIYDKAFIQLDLEYRNNNISNSKGNITIRDTKLDWDNNPLVKNKITPNPFQLDGAIIDLASAAYGPIRSNILFTEDVFIEKRTVLARHIDDLLEMPKNVITSTHPVFPVRGFEEWACPLPDSAREDLDMTILADRTIALSSILAYNKDKTEELSEWLYDVLGVGIEVHLVPPKRVLLRTKNDKTILTNEGTGAHQLPFILLPIGLSPREHTILISEPEAHLHPSAQSKLAKLFLKIVRKDQKQLFIETHSEHILHSFLNLLSKGEISINELAIYYFENSNGTANVRRLEIDMKGRVKGGLPGFFEHSLNELAEFLGTTD